ncbi:MAG: glycosyltransferase family 2 protein, partial [Gammaproteobacteria bacterium]|nr:glycosyltransferase family 2 protein [Gammaproteobacteria bacterium]
MRISVIVPTYNRSQVLGRAIQSVLDQTFPAHEIIVVDDGSTDNTKQLVRDLFPQCRYIEQPNRGVSAARNTGIESATGNWLAFLDSDDEWLPGKLRAQIALLEKNPEVKICHTEEIWIRNGKQVNQMKKHAKSGGHIFQNCLPLCVISPSSVIIHREIFHEIGAFDEELPACEDYDLWLRICASHPVAFVEQPQINKYGGHEDQLSQKHWGMDRFRIKKKKK